MHGSAHRLGRQTGGHHRERLHACAFEGRHSRLQGAAHLGSCALLHWGQHQAARLDAGQAMRAQGFARSGRHIAIAQSRLRPHTQRVRRSRFFVLRGPQQHQSIGCNGHGLVGGEGFELKVHNVGY